MNKIIKACLALVLTVCALFTTVQVIKADYNFNREYLVKNTEVTKVDINGVATRYQSTITSYNGLEVNPNKLADHVTTWIEPNLPIKESAIRVVNYTAGTSTNWQGKRPTDLAKIYERENPGWLVVGGINGDFFHISQNSEVLGTSMQEGHFYKPYKYQGQGHAALGFFDNGDYIYGTVETSTNEYVQKLNAEGAYEDICEINVVNGKPSENGVSLLTRYMVTNTPYTPIQASGTIPHDLTGYKVVKVLYEVQRLDRETKKVYLKGVVTEIVSNIDYINLDDKDSTSYLVCKDTSLDSLQIGDEIRCQAKAINAWAGVSNIAGAYNEILSNYSVVRYGDKTGSEVNLGYVNCNKNRTVMGFKEDGTPVIMVIEKGTYGAHYEECAEILKGIGCKNGYLFDGGGSSCIFMRNPDGSFSTINKQEDGTERSDGNAVLFVMRDPGFKVSTSEINRFDASVKLDITNQTFFKDVKDIKITVNGVTKEYSGQPVKFENLKESTKYDVLVTYKLPRTDKIETIVSSALTSSFTTGEFEYPEHGLGIKEVGKDYIVVCKDTTLPTSSMIKDVVVRVGDNEYVMGDNTEYKIEGLIGGTNYNVSFNYVIYDNQSSNTYPMTTDVTICKTKTYDAPVINEFVEKRKATDSITIGFEYTDNDKTVVKAYILVNDEKVELTSEIGNKKISDLNFANENYTFKLVLECEKDGDKFTIESTPLTYEATGGSPTKPTTPSTGGMCGSKAGAIVIGMITSLTMFAFVLKKRN